MPTTWICALRAYGDGTCHCGCGEPDPDCDDDRVVTCEVCNAPGSCSLGSCPGSIDASDTTRCHVPPAWGCPATLYGDDRCDCGCGIRDVDCASSSVDACERCLDGCTYSLCPGTIAPNDNRVCTSAPTTTWKCQARFYGDGSICHCGCGAIDPDCAGPERDLCDRCNVEGSCSGQACPGVIDPENSAGCAVPPPPEGWTCESYAWGNGSCDCGCGMVDLDCADATPESCDTCNGCSSLLCPGSLLPGDTTKCLPPPADWVCGESYWADGYGCECGCGAVDLDCEDASSSHCDFCPEEGCSVDRYCADVRANDSAHCVGGPPAGWTCGRVFYGDQACDCGCGAQDIDCPSTSRSVCDFCNAQGSCSSAACPGTISVNDNTTCG